MSETPKVDLHGATGGAWIGVDLDGTLAFYDGWKGPTVIGDPIPKMMDRVREWMDKGRLVKILTARVAPGKGDEKVCRDAIEAWLDKHGLSALEVTHAKDHRMIELWDDRVVQVIPNTGERADRKERVIELEKELAAKERELAELKSLNHGLSRELTEANAQLTAKDRELETERMRVVACGVVAMANTRDSAKSARDMHESYRSASCDDVARAVDREIALREKLEAKERELAEARAERIRQLESRLAEEIKWGHRNCTHDDCKSAGSDCPANPTAPGKEGG